MRVRIAAVVPGLLVLLISGCAAGPAAGAPHPQAQGTVAPAAYGRFASLSAAPTPPADTLPADCRPRSGAPYQIGAVGTFSGGSVQITEGVSVSGISGRFCAVATLEAPPPDHPDAKVCTHLVAPRDGLGFDPVDTTLDIIPGVQSRIGQVTVDPQAFSAFFCDDDTPGQLQLDTVIRASAVPELFGTRCDVGPIAASVTGALSGPLTAATATLTSGAFPVAAVRADPPACPAGLATSANAILGLPRTASAAGLRITTTAQLYLAPYDPLPAGT